MTDRPIIFSAPMIRALLDGRKTQARRVLKSPYGALEYMGGGKWKPIYTKFFRGDQLWVREGHAIVPATAYRMSEGVAQNVDPTDSDRACIYREGWDRSNGGFRWRSPIHMPRWASRLTLTVTDVRVQRLNSLTDDDAKAEGSFLGRCKCMPPQKSGDAINRMFRQTWCKYCGQEFSDLWNSIHGPGAWDANPWVAVISFTVERRNIDAVAT